MKYQEYRFRLDLQKHQSQTTINVFQGDTAVRVYMSFSDGGKPYTLDPECFAVFYGMRSDGKPLVHKCEVINSAEIMYEFQPATTFMEGIVNCQCRIYSKEQKLVTAPRFSINVEAKVVEDDDFKATDEEQSLLDRLIMGDAQINGDEAIRKEEENFRIHNESVRQLNEFGGTNAEGETVIGRVNAELAREAAEQERRDKDATRDQKIQEALDTANEAIDTVQDVVNKSLENLPDTIESTVSTHNTSTEAHADIRAKFNEYLKHISTVTGTPLNFFVGTKADYEKLTDEQKVNLFAIITDDTTKDDIFDAIEDLTEWKESLDDGTASVPNATNAAKVNNLEIKKDENGVIKIGDVIIPQKKILFNPNNSERITLSDTNDTTVYICNVSNDNAVLEVYTDKGIFKFRGVGEYFVKPYTESTAARVAFIIVRGTLLAYFLVESGKPELTISKVYEVIE